MDQYRVLYLVSRKAVTSVPLEVAGRLDLTQFNLVVVACFRSPKHLDDSAETVSLELGARSEYDVQAWWALYRLIQQHRPQILHVNHTLPAALGCLYGRLLNVPVIIYTRHRDHKDLGLVRNLLAFITIGLADLTVCNSNYTRNSFRWWERCLAGHKRTTVYNGVDIGSIDQNFVQPAHVRAELGVRAGEFVIGHVGRMVPEKDQETLIRALAILLRRGLNATVVMVGTGPLQNQLLFLVQSLALKNRVIFTGEVARERVYEILHVIDVFVMSSITEGFCNAVVEAMAARKPVIVTNAGALPEIVGGVGRFVPLRSPEALAEAILELAALSIDELKDLGEAGRKRAEACFTIERTGAAYSRLYGQLLQQRGIVAK
ncbi:MAG TPA: glycosyltransferase family 4 protein [Anaerolineae bacterium]